MKVTPAKKKFGKYEVGDVFELKDRPAKLLIKVGKLRSAEPASTGYQTRDMRAVAPSQSAYVAEPVSSPDPVSEPPIDEPTVEEIPQSEEPAADNEIESGAVDEEAPYGRKADGTPKKRPGRAPATE